MNQYLLLKSYLAETLSSGIIQPLSVFLAVSRIWKYLLKYSCKPRKGSFYLSGSFSCLNQYF